MEQIFKWVSSSSGGQFRQFFNSENSGSDNFMGGVANTVSGAYSAVLGGSGNTVSAAYNYADIFGRNITASASCAFHANCLIAPNTPAYNPLLPTGTLMRWPASLPIPATASIVLII